MKQVSRLEKRLLRIGLLELIKFLQKYKPKKILEVGMNVGSFSIIAKEVLGDVKIYSVDRQEGFVERQIQINDYYGEELISLLLSDSISNEFRNYAKENTPYDLAWIDGHHTEASSMFDIMTAINCGIPIICCDDCQPNTSTGVWKGIQKLVKNNLVNELKNNEIINIGSDIETKIIDVARLIMRILKINKKKLKLFSAPKGSVLKRKPDISKLEKIIGNKNFLSLEEGIKLLIKKK